MNLGFDHYHAAAPEQELVRMQVFTDRIGDRNDAFPHIRPRTLANNPSGLV